MNLRLCALHHITMLALAVTLVHIKDTLSKTGIKCAELYQCVVPVLSEESAFIHGLSCSLFEVW